jgi:hypothetical protein
MNSSSSSSSCMYQFPIMENYILLIRERTAEHIRKSPDVTATQVQSGKQFIILIMENKRASYALQGHAWYSAVRELIEYLDVDMNSANPKPGASPIFNLKKTTK